MVKAAASKSAKLQNRKVLTFERSLLITVVFLSLVVWPPAFDGFNAIKSIVAIPAVLIFLAIGWRNIAINASKDSLKVLFPVFLFLMVYLIRSLTSSYWPTAFFGVLGRNIGFFEYACFGIIVALLYFSRVTNLGELISDTFLVLAIIENLYGFIQSMNHDFIHWKLTYLGIPLTLGNPNFAGTFCGLSATAFLYFAMEKQHPAKRACFALFAGVSLYNLSQTHALQGALVFALSTGIWLIPLVFSYSKRVGYLYLVIGSFSVGLGAFGIFGYGPLSHFLHKASVSYRGDFYREALHMFSKNWIFGVGIDRFGVNYDLYRDNKQVVLRGISNYSDSAHNILLQFAAIGGIGLLAAYLLLLGSTGVSLTRFLLKNEKGNQRTILLFALWVGMQADSLVSPESLGLTIWSWVFLGGLLHHIRNFEPKIYVQKYRSHTSKLAIIPVISISLAVAVGVVGVRQLKAQMIVNEFFNLVADPKVPGQVEAKTQEFNYAMSLEPWNIEWPVYAANSYIDDHNFQEAIPFAEKAHQLDPQDVRPLAFLAQSYEQLGKRVQAIPYRLSCLRLDPFNTYYMLELARDYKSAMRMDLVPRLLSEIKTDDPTGIVAKIASQEFGRF